MDDDQTLRESLFRAGYIADEGLATTLWLAGELQRPLLLEGDAGVGKSELAALKEGFRSANPGQLEESVGDKVMSRLTGLIRGVVSTWRAPRCRPRTSPFASWNAT